jgi:hypothetical protein
MYNSTLSLTWAPDGVGGQRHNPDDLSREWHTSSFVFVRGEISTEEGKSNHKVTSINKI